MGVLGWGRRESPKAAPATEGQRSGQAPRGQAQSWVKASTCVFTLVTVASFAGWKAGLWKLRWEDLLVAVTLVIFCYWIVWKVALSLARHAQWAAAARLALNPWLSLPACTFPVLLLVVAVRSWLMEPYSIPSESMEPTLQAGDMVVVSKFSYGLKLPVLNTALLQGPSPARGDVVVFRSPVEPSEDWIKRVVGTPGDVVLYKDHQLFVNGKAEAVRAQGEARHPRAEPGTIATAWGYRIRLDPVETAAPADVELRFPYSENCEATVQAIRCVVPQDQYFVLGDNRNHSEDSRSWGFVPKENLLGKAEVIVFNTGDVRRVGVIR